MKISVLTPAYNRGDLIDKLHKSLIINNDNSEVDVEWLIMDDGSTDNTKEVVEGFINEKKLNIRYFYQKNKGKMSALNELVKKADGDLIIECDSDDYFTASAFKTIDTEWSRNKDNKDIYALAFLKNNQFMQNMGDKFKNKETTMFDLYFKEGETGEKALAFVTSIRKKYKYIIENDEKFSTEARMYHQMDLKYKMLCFNTPVMVCEYQENGYTNNIAKQFINNPYGYYKYFVEMFNHDFKGMIFKKRLYIIKHLILFKYLTNTKGTYKNVKGGLNKLLYILLYLPGTLKSKSFKKKN